MKNDFKNKAEARAWAKSRLLLLSLEDKKQGSRVIVGHIRHHWALAKNIETVFLFSGKDYEPDIMSLTQSQSGESPNVSFALPRVLNSHGMEFRSYKPGDSLEKNRWGILEPSLDSQVAIPGPQDLILVPCLAITKTGDRLGHGRGYYDRYLSQIATCPLRIGVCFEAMICESSAWPPDCHDAEMNAFCSETGFVTI
ncbi:MAG: 5-formyltetrahydrofolate cyclo-ligase [Proteobacteria bacterium]|nr:5-formyltetrahydrofolate cyclo-ligase [Pseudomonadota bacterium]